MADSMARSRILVTSSLAVLISSAYLSSRESEAANYTANLSKPQSPLYAVEGQNLTLRWNYALDGPMGSVKFAIVNDDGSESVIWTSFGHGINIKPENEARFQATVTDTRTELSILGVERSDEKTYILNILPHGDGSVYEEMTLVVNFLPSITEMSGNQTVTEGGNVTLKCLAYGKPTPNVTWTRISDNRIVSMPLTDITRQEAGKYKCIANNGIGSPAIGDLWIVVQYPVEAKGFGENKTVFQGGKETFSCPVDGIPKPSITWYRGGDIRGMIIFTGDKLEARDTGCYTCVARNSCGTSINITQCLTVESSTSSTSMITPEGSSWIVICVVIQKWMVKILLALSKMVGS
ncbi:protein CEPU-1-like isoform X1 [Acropora muricata]|uniref:protein CEPU-1-like isoform X1 n=1 Tax=Acropora muricata TaxID=159855 RepID=UPI0034E4899A